MAPVKCEKCGREFKNDRALKIHLALQGGGKPKARRKARKKVGRPKAAKATRGKGKFVCKVCGRSFKMAMHLARHVAAAHGKKRRKTVKKVKKVKKARRRIVRRKKTLAATGVRTGIKVNTLSIDQLLAIKAAVDGRLKGIARKMRLVKLR